MALVGNISGSSSIVGVTGSVIFANRSDALFPSSLPGGDISFFVSGSIGGKGNTAERTVAVFGGDVAVSGSLTVGTGSVKITSNDIQFGSAAMKIAKDGNDLKFFDITNPSGFTLTSLASGGGGSNTVFVDGGTKAFTTSSIVIGKAQYADAIAANVFFYVSGSNAGNADAVLAGDTVVSGSVTIRDSASIIVLEGGAGGEATLSSTTGNIVLSTPSNRLVVTTTHLQTDGSIVGTTNTSKSVFEDITATVGIGGAGSLTSLGGGLKVTGNYISGSAGNNLTLGSAGGVTVKGDLTVSGNDISGSSGVNLTLGASGDVTVAGDLTVAGNDIKSSTATAITFEGANVTTQGNLIVKGDFYVSGTTTTIDSTIVEIQDPVVGLGFASGSVAGLAGDRGLIGGITGAGNNVALIWSQNSGSFVATRTTSSPGASPVVISNLLPVRAAKLEVNGTTAYITSSDTHTLELNGGSGTGIKFTIGSSIGFAKFVDNGSNAEFGALANKQLTISGSLINLNAGNSGISLQKNGTGFASISGGPATLSITPSAGILTASIVNSVAEVINFGGAATAINIGNVAGFVAFAGDISVSGGDISTPAGTFNLVNQNATTVSMAGAAVTLNIANSATFAQTMNLATASTGSSTYNLMTGATAASATKTVNLGIGGVAGSTTNVNISSGLGGTTIVSGSFQSKGNITLGNTDSDTLTFTARVGASLLPNTDTAYDLGSPSFRWRNMYTGDLHLRNERGDWTIIEEADYLSITNNLSGRRYKFVLEEL